jgi:hypothetical protein
MEMIGLTLNPSTDIRKNMNNRKICIYLGLLSALSSVSLSYAHDDAYAHFHAGTNAAAMMKIEPEVKAPFKVSKTPAASHTSGEGFWTFVAANDLVPVPSEASPNLKGAHGTIIVDSERDIVYWGLQDVGWIGFSNKLAKSWIIKGDAAFSHGNLHGADLLTRRGKLPLVAVADNVDGEVYVSDTTFQHADVLDWPQHGPYTKKQEFHATDVAFGRKGELVVTDGYGKGFFMPADLDPLQYRGTFVGGKELSKTPHGITFDSDHKTMLVSARPEGQIKEWKLASNTWGETLGLPAGSTVCDVDLWGHYALAPCLDGPNKTPGPIYIINLKTKKIVSIIRPKEDLGFSEAQHIHDAAWYVTGHGSKTEVYIIFTNWNPGGIGALKLVQGQ